MPAALAIPLITAGVGAAASMGAAKINSGAAGSAADAASKSNAEALAFQKQQAENEYNNQEVTRRANYDTHVAQMEGNNRTRQALGLAPIAIPAYVPSVDPAFTGAPPPPPGPSIGTMAGAPAAPPPPRAAAPLTLQPQFQPLTGGYPGGTLGQLAGAPVLQPDGTYRLPSQVQRTT